MTQIAANYPTATRRPLALSFALAVVTAAVVASLVCLAVAAVAHAAGASSEMLALTPGIFVPFVVVGVIAGAVGWTVARAKARNPRRVLSVLVPVVVLVSFVPDVLVGVTKALPGTSWTAVAALMVMHLVVAVCGVTAYRVFLPLHRPEPASTGSPA